MKAKIQTKIWSGMAQILMSAIAVFAVTALIGCGPGGSLTQQNPLKNYSNLDVVPCGQDGTNPNCTSNQIKYQTKQSEYRVLSAAPDREFIQGVPGSFNIRVTGAIREQHVNYRLVLQNKDLIAMGAKLTRSANEPWDWQFQWTPPIILSSDQPSKAFNLNIEFELTGNNSVLVQKELAGLANKNACDNCEISVTKSTSVPIIQNVTPKKITINASQDVTISFTVLAKNFANNSGNITSRIADAHKYIVTELPIFTGEMAATNPTLVKNLGVDAKGYTHFLYQFTFSGQVFADQIYKQLEKNSYWHWKLQHGNVPYSEAQFKIVARNHYNGQRSAHKIVTIDVNLDTKAGTPAFVGPKPSIQLKAGDTASHGFLIGTQGGRGDISINTIAINGAPPAKVDNWGRAQIKTKDLTLDLSCAASGINLNQSVSCHTGECLRTCFLNVEAPNCSQTSTQKTLTLNLKSILGISTQPATLTIPISISGRSSLCDTVARDAATIRQLTARKVTVRKPIAPTKRITKKGVRS